MKYRKEAVHATNPEVLAAGRRKLVFAALAVLAVVPERHLPPCGRD